MLECLGPGRCAAVPTKALLSPTAEDRRGPGAVQDINPNGRLAGLLTGGFYSALASGMLLDLHDNSSSISMGRVADPSMGGKPLILTCMLSAVGFGLTLGLDAVASALASAHVFICPLVRSACAP
jgi:hypothetical protein